MKNTETPEMKKAENKTVTLWMAIGAGIGAALGGSTDNMGLWVGLGVAFGAAVGFIINKEKRSSN